MARSLAPHLGRHLEGANLVHCPFMGREAFSLAFLLAARRARTPFVFTPHRHERLLGWTSPAFRRLYSESDAVIALTDHEARWLERHGARQERLHVIGVGPLNDPDAPPEPAWRALGGRRRFALFLGQLHRYKGFDAVLDAARRLEGSAFEFEFVLAGPDVRGAGLALRSAPRNVRWLGQVNDRLRDSLLRACTVLCVPSRRESFGGVLVEAWAAGKPVIGGPAAASRELIENGVDGWSVPQQGAAVADRLAMLLADPGLAERMGARGRAKVARRWSWSRIAEAHVEVYERVLAERRG
jgi:glycosyltransferase involved in cell wall biosynthesis